MTQSYGVVLYETPCIIKTAISIKFEPVGKLFHSVWQIMIMTFGKFW